jgi:hypothetical protein
MLLKTGYGKGLTNGERQAGTPCPSTRVIYTHLMTFYEDDMSPFFLQMLLARDKLQTANPQIFNIPFFSKPTYWNCKN